MTLLALFAIFCCIVISIALAVFEAGFYLVKRRNLHRIADDDSPEMEKLSRYFEDPPSILMPIHIGTYTAHVAMTALLTALLLDLLKHWATLVALVIMIVYLLIFRLTLPYAIARRGPERVLLTLVRPFHRYAKLLSPLTTLLRRRAAGDIGDEDPNGNGHRPLAAKIEIGPAPLLAENESRIVDSLARFSTTQAREVMTPRLDITALPTSSTVAEARKLFRESQYSRLVAYAETLDDIAGVVHVRDLVSHDGPETATVESLVRPALIVPDGKKVVDLLREMQAKRLSIAILVDEYGVTAGLVSIEDILEELVGEIKDEYDVEAEPLVVSSDGVITASARVSLETLKDALHAGFEMPDDVDTVGGLAMSLFGHVPKAGERIEHQGYAIEVLEATSKRVGRVQFARSSIEVGVVSEPVATEADQADPPSGPAPGFKSGFVTIVGRPSAGKSTLLNRLVGEKVAITSDKPQTTRNRILGYVNRPNGQIAFIDTPGLIKPFHAMHARMMSVAHSAVGEADVVIWMVDTTERDGPHNRPIADLLRQSGKPVVLALNKVDKVAKSRLLPLMAGLGNRLDFKAVVPISARTGDGVEILLKAVLEQLKEGPALFPVDEFTDKSERFLVSELIREAIIHCCGQEVPYATAVLVRSWEDEQATGGKIRIAADITIEREGQKAIVIGKQGSMLKKIGTEARNEIEALLDAPVYLELFVRVRKGWREDDRAVREVIEGR